MRKFGEGRGKDKKEGGRELGRKEGKRKKSGGGGGMERETGDVCSLQKNLLCPLHFFFNFYNLLHPNNTLFLIFFLLL